MRILQLSQRIGWFGEHSGYEQLSHHLAHSSTLEVVVEQPGIIRRFTGSALGRTFNLRDRKNLAFAYLELLARRAITQPDITHLPYADRSVECLKGWKKAPPDIVGSLHLPPSQWSERDRKCLRSLASAIVLYSRDLDFFEEHVGSGRVEFVRHGVDSEFFSPEQSRESRHLRILYAGLYLRNEKMFVRVARALLDKFPNLEIHMLVPAHHQSEALAPLRAARSVQWHSGLNDHELRQLYRQCDLLLLPMDDSGANNAILEAMACGLPVITTDVGGIRDYGGEAIFPVVGNNADDDMVDLASRYLRDFSLRHRVGNACRSFAETELSWDKGCQAHVEAFRRLAGTSTKA